MPCQLRYGLCASVWSQNVGRVHRVSQQLEVRALCIETVRKYPEVISFFFSKEKKGDKFDRNCKNYVLLLPLSELLVSKMAGSSQCCHSVILAIVSLLS